MKIMTYKELQKNLVSTMDEVNENHTPIIITRKNGACAILMSLDDFNSYEETAYLMSSSKNIKRLNRAIDQIKMYELASLKKSI